MYVRSTVGHADSADRGVSASAKRVEFQVSYAEEHVRFSTL